MPFAATAQKLFTSSAVLWIAGHGHGHGHGHVETRPAPRRAVSFHGVLAAWVVRQLICLVTLRDPTLPYVIPRESICGVVPDLAKYVDEPGART